MEKPYKTPTAIALEIKYKEHFRGGDILAHIGQVYLPDVLGRLHVVFQIVEQGLPRHVVDELKQALEAGNLMVGYTPL